MTHSALVVGASGIVGSTLSRHLLDQGWRVHGLARRPPSQIDGLLPISADLLDDTSLRAALANVKPTHVFLSTWLRQKTEAENIRVNGMMVRNVLAALSPGKSVRHVALVTGLKHYLGPFEAYGKGKLPPTPFREDQPRLDIENFYYAQEDEVFAAAARDGFGWSDDLQGDRAAIRVSGIGHAVERSDGHDGCAPAGAASALGLDDGGRARSGFQYRQW